MAVSSLPGSIINARDTNTSGPLEVLRAARHVTPRLTDSLSELVLRDTRPVPEVVLCDAEIPGGAITLKFK